MASCWEMEIVGDKVNIQDVVRAVKRMQHECVVPTEGKQSLMRPDCHIPLSSKAFVTQSGAAEALMIISNLLYTQDLI